MIFSDFHVSYNSTHPFKEKATHTNIHNIGTPIIGVETTIDQMGHNLLMNPQAANIELKSNTDRLWDIDSFWSSNYYFEISNKIRISEISYEQAILHLRKRNDKISTQLKEVDTIYSVSIPDPMLMKIITILISGIKVEIIKYLQSVKSATLPNIGKYISDKLKISLMESNTKIAIDKIIRSMVVAGILRFTS